MQTAYSIKTGLFHRLDDIGPFDSQTVEFVETLEGIGNPYILAVIPDRLADEVAAMIRRLKHAWVFQHGTAHINNGSETSQDEFPTSLGRKRITAELNRGRETLQQRLGINVLGYVPPWNRMSEVVLDLLEQADFKVVSATSRIRLETTLKQAHVHVNVFSQYRPVVVRCLSDVVSEIQAQLALQREVIGIMYHPCCTPLEKVPQLIDVIKLTSKYSLSSTQWRGLLLG